MHLPIRSILALSVLVVVLAACGTTVAGSPEPSTPVATPAEPTVAPSQAPSEAPSQAPSEEPASPDVVGTLTMVDGVAVGGPGGSIAESLASGITDPMLVNGVLFMADDGTIYLASEITDAAAPTFGGPTLEVIGYPENAPEWDPANANLTGLQEVNGVLFFDPAQLFGVVES